MGQLVDFVGAYSGAVIVAFIGLAVAAVWKFSGSAIKRAWLAVWDRRIEGGYRRALAAKCEFLRTLGLPEHPGSSVKLRDVYVEPRIEISELSSAIDLDRVGEADARSGRDPDARPERAPKIETVSVAEALKRYDKLVILGEPGLGKSTLLCHLALSFAAGEGPAEEFPLKHGLPIHVRLRDVVGSDLKHPIEPLVSACTSLTRHSAQLFVRRSLEAGRCLLLLDGLDEVAEPGKRAAVSEWIENLLSAYPGNRCVVASRPMGYWSSPLAAGFKVGRTLGFSPEQVKLCVGNWYRAVNLGSERDLQPEADRLASDLQKDDRLSELAACPLLLCLMIFVRMRKGQLPSRRVELYEQLANLLLEDWQRQSGGEVKLDAPACRELLSGLALSFHRDRIQAAPRWKVEESLAAGLTDLGIAVERRHEYLQYLRERVPFFEEHGDAQTGFWHPSLQEYMAALALVERTDAVDFLVARRFDPWWREVVLLFAGGRDPSDLVKQLLAEREDIFKSSLLLAGMCVADAPCVGPAVREETAKRIDALYWEGEFGFIRDSALEVLAALKDEGVLQRMSEKAQSQNSEVRSRAARALGNIGGEKALESLIHLLRDEDSDVRSRAARALGNVGGEKALELLIPFMQDADPGVRGSAARAFGNVGGEKALESLIPLLKDRDSGVRSTAADALGNVGGEGALEILIPLLQDGDSLVRGSAAYALGSIGGEKALEILIPLLQDGDSLVRGSAAYALGTIGGEKALKSLIPLLKDEDPFVRASAARALGSIGGEQAVESLLPLLQDEDSYVRVNAAKALGNIGGEKALEILIPLLKDEDFSVRASAVRALGDIGGQRALEILIPLLKDEVFSVRWSATHAVGDIGGQKASESLISLLKGEDPVMRWMAASALKQICAREGLVIYEDGQVERIEGSELGSGPSPS